MTMTRYERDDRPVREPEDPRRAAMARRTLTRWAVRLALREWKQRILIVLLIAVASAATLLGIAVASATPGTPNAGTFGTASTLAELPGNTPDLPSVIAKIEKAYGTASVVYDEPIATGQAGGADLRAQDPSAPYTRVLLALDSGRYPTGPGQVAVTSGVAQLYSLRVGSTWRVPAGSGTAAGRVFTVTGIVENPTNLLDEFALVAPGQLTSPSQVRVFLGESLDSAAASAAGDVLPKSAVVSTPMPEDSVLSPATIVLIISVLGLVFIGLVATASFTVMAQRRQRALGMLSSLGATEADVRFVLIADGLIGGVAGAILGAAAALGGWLWYYPHLETATAHRTDPFSLPWAAVIIGLLLAVATSVIAASWPGRSVSKVRSWRPSRAGSTRPSWSTDRSDPASSSWPRACSSCTSPAARTATRAAGTSPSPDAVLRDRGRSARAVHRRQALPAGLARPAGLTAGAARHGAVPVQVRRRARGGLVRGVHRHDRDRHRQHQVQRRA